MLEAILSYTAIASSVLAWTGDPVSKQQSSERAHDSFSHCYPKNHNIWKENSLVDTLPPALRHPPEAAPGILLHPCPTSSPTPTTPPELSKIPGARSLCILLSVFNSKNLTHRVACRGRSRSPPHLAVA